MEKLKYLKPSCKFLQMKGTCLMDSMSIDPDPNKEVTDGFAKESDVEEETFDYRPYSVWED